MEIRNKATNLPIDMCYDVNRVLLSKRSPLHAIDVVEIPVLGRTLFLDGALQSAEADERIYHEALVHPAMILHNDAKRVLIGGAGEGATAREVLRHRPDHVVAYEIDSMVTEACQDFLRYDGAKFSSLDVEIITGNVTQGFDSTWDVIILDMVIEPVDTAGVIEASASALNRDGILVAHAGQAHYLDPVTMRTVLDKIHGVFQFVMPYHTNVPSMGSEQGFVLASHSPIRTPTARNTLYSLRERFAVLEGCLTYTAGYHSWMFHWPQFMWDSLHKFK